MTQSSTTSTLSLPRHPLERTPPHDHMSVGGFKLAIRFGWTRPQARPKPSDDEALEEVSSAPAEHDVQAAPDAMGPAGTPVESGNENAEASSLETHTTRESSPERVHPKHMPRPRRPPTHRPQRQRLRTHRLSDGPTSDAHDRGTESDDASPTDDTPTEDALADNTATDNTLTDDSPAFDTGRDDTSNRSPPRATPSRSPAL